MSLCLPQGKPLSLFYSISSFIHSFTNNHFGLVELQQGEIGSGGLRWQDTNTVVGRAGKMGDVEGQFPRSYPFGTSGQPTCPISDSSCRIWTNSMLQMQPSSLFVFWRIKDNIKITQKLPFWLQLCEIFLKRKVIYS